MHTLKIKVGNAGYLRAASYYVRMNVFVFERKLNSKDEFDQNDRENTIYSVVFNGNLPVSTARFLPLDEDVVRITRVATLKDYRGKQLGSKVITALEKIAKKQQFKKIMIHSELTAVGFYESLGYLRSGSIYKEDGVDCISLIKMISNL